MNRSLTIGLTLVEMLVVFVLLGLVSTLLLQGTAFFSSRYETVQGLHRDGSLAGLQQHWFVSTVQALVPYGRENRRFRGTSAGFEGLTLQALVAEPGMPATARWTIDERDGIHTLIYGEESEQFFEGVEWPVLTSMEPGLRFQYADARGRWRIRWPVDDAPNDWLPRAIRLATGAETTLWIARIDPSAMPLLTEEQFR